MRARPSIPMILPDSLLLLLIHLHRGLHTAVSMLRCIAWIEVIAAHLLLPVASHACALLPAC